MAKRHWQDLCGHAFQQQKFLCVGLDPDHGKIPAKYQDDQGEDVLPEVKEFCTDVIDAVGGVAGFLKPNWAFFFKYGLKGLILLQELVKYSQEKYPQLAVILDCKVGDIGDTNRAYAYGFFHHMRADAITIHGYLGQAANQPFLDYKDKGFFVLCHTSNPGAEEFQHLNIGERDPLYLRVAENVSRTWNTSGNCGLVVGATFPEAVSQARAVAPTLPFLVPGIGKQGGDLEKAVKGAMRSDGAGFIINSSSGIIFAPDPQHAAQELHTAILAARH